MDLLFRLVMHALAASVCVLAGVEPHPWCLRMILSAAELPGQRLFLLF